MKCQNTFKNYLYLYLENFFFMVIKSIKSNIFLKFNGFIDVLLLAMLLHDRNSFKNNFRIMTVDKTKYFTCFVRRSFSYRYKSQKKECDKYSNTIDNLKMYKELLKQFKLHRKCFINIDWKLILIQGITLYLVDRLCIFIQASDYMGINELKGKIKLILVK